ncbi:hypothetical protein D3C81_1829360 [compost metagenome]
MVQVVQQLFAIMDEVHPVGWPAFAERLAGEQAVIGVVLGNQDGDWQAARHDFTPCLTRER